MIDDIQCITGIEYAQEEFLRICKTLEESEKQVVCVSDKSLHEMTKIVDSFREQFPQSLLADIQPPEEELLIKITKRNVEQLDTVLTDDVINYIVANVFTSIRELEGVIKGIIARKEILGEEITIDSVKAHLKYIESINDVSKKNNRIPENISVNIELNIKKLCENTGFINLDEDDYKSVLDEAQQVYLGSGHAAGECKSKKAARLAITNPLMAMPIIEASKMLILITGSMDIDLSDIEDAAQVIIDAVHPDTKIIFGAFFDEDMENEMRVDVIATK